MREARVGRVMQMTLRTEMMEEDCNQPMKKPHSSDKTCVVCTLPNCYPDETCEYHS